MVAVCDPGCWPTDTVHLTSCATYRGNDLFGTAPILNGKLAKLGNPGVSFGDCTAVVGGTAVVYLMIRCSFVLWMVTANIKKSSYVTPRVLYRIRMIAAVVMLFLLLEA